MLRSIRRRLLGKPMHNKEMATEKLPKWKAPSRFSKCDRHFEYVICKSISNWNPILYKWNYKIFQKGERQKSKSGIDQLPIFRKIERSKQEIQ